MLARIRRDGLLVGLLGWLTAAAYNPLSCSAETAEPGAFDALFRHSVPLTRTGAGSLTLSAELGGVSGAFLLDTGASLVTVNPELFERLQERGGAVRVRRVGARLASGKIEALDVYRVERFVLEGGCDLGPVEVAVMKRGGRNLLGLSALQQAAPFAVSTSPPALGLSRCGAEPVIAAR